MKRAPRLIAYYLPQYHPIPENDEFWGPGFTEWTRVAAARPMFPGHKQPRLPGALGFYDLRLAETRLAQAELARAAGIEGFCYWHYWMAGRRLLERPFQEVLASGEPDFPFCLGWANHSWTRRWVGRPKEILVEQTYPGPEDHAAHFQAILPALRDPRYLTVDGRPIFLVFRPDELPEGEAFCTQWRELAVRSGLLGMHLVGLADAAFDLSRLGFDASVQVSPRYLPPTTWWRRQRHRLDRWLGRPYRMPYSEYIERVWHDAATPVDYPVALSNWDTTPRKQHRGVVLTGGTPELYRRHLRDALARTRTNPPGQRIVILKSWNEWGEGNYLEPDREFGLAWLEVVREEIDRAQAEWQADHAT